MNGGLATISAIATLCIGLNPVVDCQQRYIKCVRGKRQKCTRLLEGSRHNPKVFCEDKQDDTWLEECVLEVR